MNICFHSFGGVGIYLVLELLVSDSRGRAGIKTQTQRMDVRTRGRGRVSWDKVREWHGHIHTTKCKIES